MGDWAWAVPTLLGGEEFSLRLLQHPPGLDACLFALCVEHRTPDLFINAALPGGKDLQAGRPAYWVGQVTSYR